MTEEARCAPKQIIVLRKDLGMRKGKMIAQGAHASMAAILQQRTTPHAAEGEAPPRSITLECPEAMAEWLNESFAKIAVGVKSEAELVEVYERAREAGLPCALIRDAGRTEFGGVPTLTACAVGPAYPDEVDPITGELSLL